MSISSFDTAPYAQKTHSSSGVANLIGLVGRRWQEYRLMRAIESVPYDVMKDVGFPAAERTHEM